MEKTKNKEYETATFHVELGPESLFERVRFKMDTVRRVDLETMKVRERALQRKIPDEVVEMAEEFDAYEWELISCEVRTDTGRFVSSTWRVEAGEGDENFQGDTAAYLLTIGKENVAEDLRLEKKSDGVSRETFIADGTLYDFVEVVNRALMDGGL